MFLFIDTETGGLDPRQHSLLDITLLVADGVNELDRANKERWLHLDLQPADGIYHVTPAALRKNGINLSERNAQLYTYEAAGLVIAKFLLNHRNLTPVGWNLPFDLGFIHTHVMDKPDWEIRTSYRNIDLQSVARLLTACGVINPKGNSLVHVADYFGLDTSGAHDSTFDVNMMYSVFLKLRAVLTGGINGITTSISKQAEGVPALS